MEDELFAGTYDAGIVKYHHLKSQKIQYLLKGFKHKFGKSKGQLISKGLFGILKSSKKPNENINVTTKIPQVDLFSLFFERI